MLFVSTSWVDTLIWIGYRRELTQDDMYSIPEYVKSQNLLEHFNK